MVRRAAGRQSKASSTPQNRELSTTPPGGLPSPGSGPVAFDGGSWATGPARPAGHSKVSMSTSTSTGRPPPAAGPAPARAASSAPGRVSGSTSALCSPRTGGRTARCVPGAATMVPVGRPPGQPRWTESGLSVVASTVLLDAADRRHPAAAPRTSTRAPGTAPRKRGSGKHHRHGHVRRPARLRGASVLAVHLAGVSHAALLEAVARFPCRRQGSGDPLPVDQDVADVARLRDGEVGAVQAPGDGPVLGPGHHPGPPAQRPAARWSSREL